MQWCATQHSFAQLGTPLTRTPPRLHMQSLRKLCDTRTRSRRPGLSASNLSRDMLSFQACFFPPLFFSVCKFLRAQKSSVQGFRPPNQAGFTECSQHRTTLLAPLRNENETAWSPFGSPGPFLGMPGVSHLEALSPVAHKLPPPLNGL